LLIVNGVFRAYIGATALIMFISMVADTLDMQELRTGQRQEGVFNSATAFMSKATSGMGVLITGFLLDVVVGFPAGTQAQNVGADTIWRLGAVDGFLVPAFHIVPMLLILRFGITKDVHRDIRARLTTLRSNSAGRL
jgi:Na+/melibiose symporter-like transporter